ncbi:hypothetical protein V2J09_004321 [Rumex salicifolius]
MAAATISRRSRSLRCNIHQLRTLVTSSSSSSLATSDSSSQLPISSFRRPAPLFPLGTYRYQELKSLGLCHRYFSSSAPSSPSSTPEAKSGDDGGSGDSRQQTRNEGKSVRGSPVSWLSMLLLLLTGAGIVFYYDQEKKRHIEEISNASTAVKEGPSAGKASIGGPFNLINDHGNSVTDRDFLGKWTLIYFGFTHCPDICPDELIKMAAAIDKIKENSGKDIIPVFISVDPERDTVEQVHEYVKEFHPKLIGLTGTPEEVRKVARSYRVYYMKTEEEGSDYLVDHSIVMYLMSPSMEFVKFFGKNNDVESLANGVINEVKKYKNLSPNRERSSQENSGKDIIPVFISVDPERDTVEQVHEYVKEFHPKLIGLTGTPEEVRKVARSYRVYYMKTEEEGSDYLVDHSIVMYLMSPSMEFVKFFGKNNDVESLANGVINEVKKYKNLSPNRERSSRATDPNILVCLYFNHSCSYNIF